MPEHALLSASSAHRWLQCTAAPRFEAEFEDSVSACAEEGRLAHAICELKVLKSFTETIKPRTYTTRFKKLRADPLYQDEMDKTSDIYIDYLTETAMRYDAKPSVAAEVRVDLSDYVPDGFGTCDCVMIGGDTLTIVDYKHGKGVPVSATNNPQMRLYALGALKRYAPVYGDAIKNISMTIVQPRIKSMPESETITVEALLAWGESVKPIAAKAYMGLGEFRPGDHCRFCRGRAQCRARARQNMALEEFKDRDKLTDAEIGGLLTRGQDLCKWYKDLENYALNKLLAGGEILGWKAVAGRSVRAFADPDAAIAAVLAAGYDEALVYDRKPKTLAELEKLMGKAEFAEKLGSFVTKPQGKPTLAPETDSREVYNSAAADFITIKTDKGD